jgi:hypothetical protein
VKLAQLVRVAGLVRHGRRCLRWSIHRGGVLSRAKVGAWIAGASSEGLSLLSGVERRSHREDSFLRGSMHSPCPARAAQTSAGVFRRRRHTLSSDGRYRH